MLSYDEAVACIAQHVPPTRRQRVPLDDALGLRLAEPVVARIDLPGFDHSAVDGYAVHGQPGVLGAWRVIGRAEAGRPFRGRLRRGEAVRILTGARVPAGTAAVLMQEDTQLNEETLTVEQLPRAGQHIRRAGEDVRAGTTVLDTDRKSVV